jgi:hypothetical protein
MRIKPNGIPTPRPMARVLEFEGLEDGVAGEVPKELVVVNVFADTEVVGELIEAIVGEIDAVKDVESCPGLVTSVPTGTSNAFPASQQAVPFGPQQ